MGFFAQFGVDISHYKFTSAARVEWRTLERRNKCMREYSAVDYQTVIQLVGLLLNYVGMGSNGKIVLFE